MHNRKLQYIETGLPRHLVCPVDCRFVQHGETKHRDNLISIWRRPCIHFRKKEVKHISCYCRFWASDQQRQRPYTPAIQNCNSMPCCRLWVHFCHRTVRLLALLKLNFKNDPLSRVLRRRQNILDRLIAICNFFPGMTVTYPQYLRLKNLQG